MDFIDEAKIYIKSGDGGNGCCSFRHEKYVEKGGPDGGDGGKGGDIIVQADKNVHTLLDQRYRPHYKGKRGQHGMGKDMTGRGGDDCLIRVPVGTLIKDFFTGELIADLVDVNQKIVLAKGGLGGRGNARFATSTNQAPRYCEDGRPGQELTLKLELKLLADVGLVGFPNAGKSTFISMVSNARPKIADYPFTTLKPNLGLVRHKGADFIMADIPGIIEGAHEGVGLGLKFLKHVERTRLIVYVLDMSPESGRDPEEEFAILKRELSAFADGLVDKGRIVMLNKCDLPEGLEKANELAPKLEAQGYTCFLTSAAINEGLEKLVDEIIRMLDCAEIPEES